MNTKDEIVDVMDGYTPAGAPPPVLFTQTGTLGQMEHCGSFWPEANFDVGKMVELALQPSRMFGFATARIPFSVSTEAEAIGCFVEPGTQTSQPYVSGSPWRTDGSVPPITDDIPTADEFMYHHRIRMMIDAAERISLHDDLFLTSMCDCPTMVASHMLGMENMLIGMMLDRDTVMQWIDHLLPHICALASELSSVSDNVMLIADLSTDLMPPEDIIPLVENDRRILSSAKDSFTTVHNCGNTIGMMDELSSLKADMVSLETSLGHRMYMDKSKGKMRLMGGVNTVRTLLTQPPQEVLRECREAADMGFCLIAPECGVPPLTPNANLKALAEYRSL